MTWERFLTEPKHHRCALPSIFSSPFAARGSIWRCDNCGLRYRYDGWGSDETGASGPIYLRIATPEERAAWEALPRWKRWVSKPAWDLLEA